MVTNTFATGKYIYQESKWNGFSITQDDSNIYLLYWSTLVYSEKYIWKKCGADIQYPKNIHDSDMLMMRYCWKKGGLTIKSIWRNWHTIQLPVSEWPMAPILFNIKSKKILPSKIFSGFSESHVWKSGIYIWIQELYGNTYSIYLLLDNWEIIEQYKNSSDWVYIKSFELLSNKRMKLNLVKYLHFNKDEWEYDFNWEKEYSTKIISVKY